MGGIYIGVVWGIVNNYVYGYNNKCDNIWIGVKNDLYL